MLRKLILVLACSSFAVLNAAGDAIILKAGNPREGTIKDFDGRTIRIETEVRGQTGVIAYSLQVVEAVEFDRSDEEKAIVASLDKSKLASIERIWKEREKFLGIPGNDASVAAFALARTLLSFNDKAKSKQALELAEKVFQTDPSTLRKIEAKMVKASALARLGKFEEAQALADQIGDVDESTSESFSQARASTKLLTADLAWAKMLELEEEWPKWKLMPQKRLERSALINKALDDFLFIVVKYPKLKEESARGLWRACEIYQYIDKTEQAEKRAKEIIEYYPVAGYLEKAQKLVSGS